MRCTEGVVAHQRGVPSGQDDVVARLQVLVWHVQPGVFSRPLLALMLLCEAGVFLREPLVLTGGEKVQNCVTFLVLQRLPSSTQLCWPVSAVQAPSKAAFNTFMNIFIGSGVLHGRKPQGPNLSQCRRWSGAFGRACATCG